MALQSISGGLFLPYPPGWGGAPAFQAVAVDASGEKAATVFQAPATGTLDKFEFRLGSVSSAQALKVSFQNVSLADGNPDGTVDEFRVIASGSVTANTWIAPGLMTSDGTDGGTKRSVTRGDLIACVVEFDSTVGNINVSTLALGQSLQGVNYVELFASAAWTKINSHQPVLAIKYDTGVYHFIAPDVLPISALNNVTYNTGSASDERGLIFSVPWPCTVDGAWTLIDLDGDTDLVLYDSGGTALQTLSLDKDVRQITSAKNNYHRFPASVNLTAGATYRLVAKPTTATSIILTDYDVPGVAYMNACSGGSNFHYTERADGGTWTQTTTKRPWMGIHISAFDDGAGVGGGGNTYSRGRVVNA